MTRYRIPLSDFEWRVAHDALSSFGGSDPFVSDGDTMISDSDHREGLESFCLSLGEMSRHTKHDLESKEDLRHGVEDGDYTQEEADRYADTLAHIAGKIRAAVGEADEAAEKEAKEEEFQEWYEAELEREAEL